VPAGFAAHAPRVREGDGDQGFERANELSWTVFENTRDLLRAKNAGVTIHHPQVQFIVVCMAAPPAPPPSQAAGSDNRRPRLSIASTAISMTHGTSRRQYT
jgi:hypothetical protein